MYYYLFSWIVFCFVNFYFLIKNPSEFTLTSTPYLKFLLRPWKIVTFIVATLGIILIAPYTGDPTWDYIDAALMSILTFVTAPWSIGTLYRGIKFKVVNKSEILAVCLWMFSASWSYDLYLLLRDGLLSLYMVFQYYCLIYFICMRRLILEFGLENESGRDFFFS